MQDNQRGQDSDRMNVSNCADLRVTITGHVMNIVLDRPKSLNAHSLEMLCEMERVLELAQTSIQIKRIVISSSRRKVFCAGGDIKAVAGYSRDGRYDLVRQYFQTNKRVLQALRGAPAEVVCLVDGFCFGGGFGLNVASGIKIATVDSTFAMPEARIGFYPDVCASYYLARMPEHVGRAVGAEAAVLTAGAALRYGIVDRLIVGEAYEGLLGKLTEGVSIDDLTIEPLDHEVSVELISQKADEISLCPTSVAVAEYLTVWASDKSIDECLEFEADLSFRMAIRADFVDGVTAVLGKRPMDSWSPAVLDTVELASVLDCPLQSLQRR